MLLFLDHYITTVKSNPVPYAAPIPVLQRRETPPTRVTCALQARVKVTNTCCTYINLRSRWRLAGGVLLIQANVVGQEPRSPSLQANDMLSFGTWDRFPSGPIILIAIPLKNAKLRLDPSWKFTVGTGIVSFLLVPPVPLGMGSFPAHRRTTAPVLLLWSMKSAINYGVLALLAPPNLGRHLLLPLIVS